MKKVFRSIIFSLAAIILFLVLSISILYKYSLTENSENQTPFQNWILNVSDDRENLTLTYLGKEKSMVADVAVDGVHIDSVPFEDNILSLPIVGSPTTRVVNEIRIKITENLSSFKIHTLQLARETPGYLKKRYGFTHKSGYVVIGRSTFLLKPVEERFSESKIPFVSIDSDIEKQKVLKMLDKYKPDALQILRSNANCPQAALSKAKLITQFLWSVYSSAGPSDKIKSGMGTYQILKAIEDDGGSVQCTSTRDLFISIAHISESGLKTRKVDAFRYYPHIPNVVVNGHSFLEIKTERGWFLFDPFVRIYFKKSSNNRLLSAADIREFFELKSLDQIKPIHVETSHEERRDIDYSVNHFDPYNWNYFTNFYYLSYNELKSDISRLDS